MSLRKNRVREIDFRRPSKFNREQVRRLEHSHDTFCQSASSRLSAELRTELQLGVLGTDQLPYSVGSNLKRDRRCLRSRWDRR